MQKNDAFSGLHPIVNFIYFAFAIVLSACLMHPVCLAISAISSIVYARRACGSEAIGRTMRFAVPMMLLTAVLNPLFSHGGVTTLCYLPSGNPLTLESVFYGLAAAVMLFSVLIWFSCFSYVITTDKFVWLFGRIIPTLSLVLSMTLRFIPRFTRKFRDTYRMQLLLSGGVPEEGLKASARLKTAVKAFSGTVTWALENSIETADSMRARGYGLTGRTSYSIYRFEKRDRRVLMIILALGTAVLAGWILGTFKFTYYPAVNNVLPSAPQVIVFAAYAAFLLIPVLTDRKDERNWMNSR